MASFSASARLFYLFAIIVLTVHESITHSDVVVPSIDKLDLTPSNSQQLQSESEDRAHKDNVGVDLAYQDETRVRYQPRHIHISYGDKPTEMFITWSTVDNPKESIVEYGLYDPEDPNPFRDSTSGNVTEFKESGPAKLKQFIHRVKLENLVQGKIYVYHCGSNLGWSELFYFTAMPSGNNWSPRFAMFGDMGNENAKSLTRLQKEVQLGMYDAIFHVGDFAYDMDTDDGRVGDAFMEEIQPIAAYVPYMTCPGNHEHRDNFAQYKNRFTMPGSDEAMMYSFDMGPIHFIAISTEFYYFLQYGIKPLVKQYEWLQAELKEANKPENRENQPWIITYGHRPMYCSNLVGDCNRYDTLVRVGIPYVNWFGLEDLFMEYGVDLTIWAHEHSYERLWPLYNHTVYNGSLEEPYRNPKAMVHVTTGSAGCKYGHDEFPPTEKPHWSAFRTTDYGYSRVHVLNKTHLYFEQVSDDQDGKVIDSFTLIREEHTPYQLYKD